MSEVLKAAKAYASRGWRVFPLKPDNGDGRTLKEPAVEWKTEATTSIKQIEEWFTEDSNFGIGIAAGNGISILDVDTKKQGDVTLETYATEEDYETPTVRTPTGGVHMYYLTPDDREIKNWVSFLPGLDVRTDGGYVVAPPTTRDGKPYVWEKSASKTPIIELPEWVKKYPKAGQGEVKGYQDTDWIVPGEWNNKMVSIAGVEVHRAHSEEELAARLLAISQTRSHPDHRAHSAEDIERLGRIAHDAWENWRKDKKYEQTEEGQAEFFADMFKERAKFNWSTKKWMVWKEHWWEEDAGGKVRTYVGEAYKQRLANARIALKAKNDSLDAHIISDKKLYAEACKEEMAELAFAKAMGSYRAQEDVWNLARKSMGSKKLDWDTDPYLIGVNNGVVDLRTGALQAGKPEDNISKHIDLDYQQAGPAPVRWPRFVLEIFGDDAQMADFFQRALGYSLTGLTREQVWFLCYGAGSNGKSTALQDTLLKHVFGPYGAVASIETFTVRNNRSAISHDIADLEGKRFVDTSEPRDRIELDEERMKSVTTGGRVRADKKHQDAREFTPTLKLWLETNHLPNVKDNSEGFWRRVRYIPFVEHFEWPEKMKPGDRPIDKNITADLEAEKQAILWWVVQGAVKYFTDGLRTPQRVLQATDEFRENEDTFGQWMRDVLSPLADVNARAETKTEDLYKSFKNWHMQQGTLERYIPSKMSFTKTLNERSPNAYKRTQDKRFWQLALLEHERLKDAPDY